MEKDKKTKKENPKAKEKIEKKVDEDNKKTESLEFVGEYLKAVGRRKTAVAQVRLYKNGKGSIIVNEKKASHYFPGDSYSVINQFLKTINQARDYDFSVLVKGGGKSAQAEAVRHGMARTILLADEDLADILKVNNYLTRDSRKKERKKPGLKKARKRPQWSKR